MLHRIAMDCIIFTKWVHIFWNIQFIRLLIIFGAAEWSFEYFKWKYLETPITLNMHKTARISDNNTPVLKIHLYEQQCNAMLWLCNHFYAKESKLRNLSKFDIINKDQQIWISNWIFLWLFINCTSKNDEKHCENIFLFIVHKVH